MRPEDIQLCREWAELYRSRGFNPLPSRPDEKRPCCSFVERYGWDKPFPREEFEQWETTNIQIQCGRPWRLLVIDLDGAEARQWWIDRSGGLPRTWITHSGGDGWHLWFTITKDVKPDSLPKGFLWKGAGPHS